MKLLSNYDIMEKIYQSKKYLNIDQNLNKNSI